MPTPATLTEADVALALALAAPRKGFAPHLAADLDAEATLAAIEARADPAAPADADAFRAFAADRIEAALGRLRRGERRNGITFPGAPLDRADGFAAMTPTSAVSRRPAKAMTAGRRRKARRNVVIAAAARQGCSQRLIAEAFGLPRSLVAEIIAATDPARRRPAPEPEDD